MPGWHEFTKKFVKEGKLQVIGVIQEQHPERCQLFAQWKNLDWPIVHDPINLLANSAVPMAIAIDEHGIVRSRRANQRTFEKEFLNVKFESVQTEKEVDSIGVTSDWKDALEAAQSEQTAVAYKRAGDSVLLWAGKQKISAAINAYKSGLKSSPVDASFLFRSGVAYLMRHESDQRQPNDFAKAVDHWNRALAANPNQYIWRRRIQQYGPRLDKPYPFYDWVNVARQEIQKRGQQPVVLPVEPVGAELATQSRSIKESTADKNPDPKNLIRKDPEPLVQIESVIVPHTSKGTTSSMIHILFSPHSNVKWSNDAGPLTVWVEGKDVVQSQKLFQVTNRTRNESNERRKIEFEISKKREPLALKGYALYYVCKDSGECQYVRQDFEITLDETGK